MMTIRLAIAVAVGLPSALLAGANANARSLEETVSSALASHPGVKASYKRRLSASERVKIERGALFPKVNLRGETGYEYTDSTTTRNRATRGPRDSHYASLFRNRGEIVVNQLIFDGFQTHNLVNAARVQLAKAGKNIVDTRLSVALQAVAAHIDVNRNRQFVSIARQNVGAHQAILAGIRRQVSGGRATSADVAQARTRLSNAIAVLRTRIGALREAQVRYESIVGLSAGPKMDVPNPGHLQSRYRRMSTQEALQIAARRNPKVGIAKSEVRSRKHRLKATRGLFLPKVEFEATLGTGNNIDGVRGPDSEMKAMVILTWNLYRGGSDIARRREALANLAVAKFDEADQRRIVREQVRQAVEALKATRSRLGPLHRRVAAATQVVSAYARQFDAGRRTLLDRLDVQNDLFLARAERVNVYYTHIYNYFSLVAATGELLEYFGQVRDPKAAKFKVMSRPRKRLQQFQ
jgi:adhesin transport system outer membrane protein